jgi:formate dehydrogenase major subunit
VAKRQGTTIPHLCHKPAPGYRPDGNCRACMVEIEGERTLAASCIREPAEGMVSPPNSARAEKARKMVMEMLLADQPEREDAHDRSSHCGTWPRLNGVTESRFPKLEAERIPLLDDSHVRCASTSMPASSAGCACAPAARCRSTT